MAAIYVMGALIIILMNAGDVIPTFGLIFREAFNPTASIAGSGTGIFLLTMMWGVKRGLFSNEAGQGSAPIAHAAAKTDEPVSEGVVALVEPFIDTIVICTMTGLVIILTGVWNATIPTEITLDRGDISYMVERAEGGYRDLETAAEIRIEAGRYIESGPGAARLAWHEVPVEALYLDAEQTQAFDGIIDTEGDIAIAVDGTQVTSLYGNAVESGAPLTMLAFQRGLPGQWGKFIVVISVFLFAISTAIAWSYYGDRCANYLFGHRAVLPYKFAFVTMHFVGAILTLAVVWTLGDVFLGIVILPNLLALLLLSGKVAAETKSYFARKPWIENREVRRRLREQRRARPGAHE
jgi:AGCS family alanine or glycine:cation symporter